MTGFPEVEQHELPFRLMGKLVLNTVVQTLHELVEREMAGHETIVDRLRNEGF